MLSFSNKWSGVYLVQGGFGEIFLFSFNGKSTGINHPANITVST